MALRTVELVEDAETVGRIRAAIAAGQSTWTVAAELGLGIQALRELLARHAQPDGAPAR